MENNKIYIKHVIECIESGDPNKAHNALIELGDLLLKDKSVAVMLASPPMITEVHKKLMEHLAIPDRLLLLRNRVPNVHRRAVMFNAIMIAAVKKVHHDKLV